MRSSCRKAHLAPLLFLFFCFLILFSENWLRTHHDGEDQSQDVDGVGGAEAGENGQAQVAAQRRRSLLLRHGDTVQEGAGAQGALHLGVERSQRHAASASPGQVAGSR